jgi:putative flippase GtrA
MTRDYFKYFKYIVSGGTAAFINIALIYGLTEYLHIYYLLSATMGFIFGALVSFFLQKFWTFQDNRRSNLERQLFWYFTIGLVNLALNTVCIYVLVEYLHVWYVAAAFVVGLLIAFVSFFIYRRFIFTTIDRKKFI